MVVSIFGFKADVVFEVVWVFHRQRDNGFAFVLLGPSTWPALDEFVRFTFPVQPVMVVLVLQDRDERASNVSLEVAGAIPASGGRRCPRCDGGTG